MVQTKPEVKLHEMKNQKNYTELQEDNRRNTAVIDNDKSHKEAKTTFFQAYIFSFAFSFYGVKISNNSFQRSKPPWSYRQTQKDNVVLSF